MIGERGRRSGSQRKRVEGDVYYDIGSNDQRDVCNISMHACMIVIMNTYVCITVIC
jgi:hypothetical protein